MPLANAQNSVKPTLGTVQMPGDNGKLKTTYQLGAKGSELHFNLESATVAFRYPVQDANLAAIAKERLLILTFTVQNPLPREQSFAPSSFQFTVVSPDDKNFEHRGYLYDPVKKVTISQNLKPAQKVRASIAIPIYAGGPVDKLIVKRGSAPVLRYSLAAGTTKLTSAFSPDGITLADDGQVSLNKAFDFGAYDVEIQEVGTADKIGDLKAGEGNELIYIMVKISNPMLKPVSVGFQYFTPTLTDANGEKISWTSELLSASSGKRVYQDVEPGEFIRAQYVFSAPKGTKPDRLKLLSNPSGRTAILKL